MTAMSKMPDFDVADFRQTLGCFPTGVTIVTAMTQTGAPVGVTISSFNSVSMDPPLVLWSLARNAASLPVFHASDGFAINVLSAEQADLPRVFSSPVAERFDAVVHLAAYAGVRPSIERPDVYQRVNVEGTLNLLERCRIVIAHRQHQTNVRIEFGIPHRG